MNTVFIIILLVLLYLFYIWYYRYSHYNNILVSPCTTCEKYYVHKYHNDQQKAAKIMEDITKRNNILIEHLKNKYSEKNFNPGLEPTKNNRIDIIPIELNTDFKEQTKKTVQDVMENEYIRERLKQLTERYDPKDIHEISPLNNANLTSYTQDKKTLILCLRKKQQNKNKENELHDINTIMFVVIHELSHMMNNRWGHGVDFWVLFKFMLMNAVEAGVYTPVDYSKKQINYCGLNIGYNPLYDKVL